MKAQLGVLCLTHKEEKNCERLIQLDTLIKIHMDSIQACRRKQWRVSKAFALHFIHTKQENKAGCYLGYSKKQIKKKQKEKSSGNIPFYIFRKCDLRSPFTTNLSFGFCVSQWVILWISGSPQTVDRVRGLSSANRWFHSSSELTAHLRASFPWWATFLAGKHLRKGSYAELRLLYTSVIKRWAVQLTTLTCLF